jgi:hypothetical protein
LGEIWAFQDWIQTHSAWISSFTWMSLAIALILVEVLFIRTALQCFRNHRDHVRQLLKMDPRDISFSERPRKPLISIFPEGKKKQS